MSSRMRLANAPCSEDRLAVPQGNRPIAIIEDDPGVLDSLRFMLEALGYKVATYDSAAAFLREDEGRALHLIIDQHMPQKTGLELAQQLRAQGDDRPILLITAAPNPSIYARAHDLRIERVLEKPLAEDDLFAFVQRLP